MTTYEDVRHADLDWQRQTRGGRPLACAHLHFCADPHGIPFWRPKTPQTGTRAVGSVSFERDRMASGTGRDRQNWHYTG